MTISPSLVRAASSGLLIPETLGSGPTGRLASWVAVAAPCIAELDSLVLAVEKGDKDAALASHERAYWTLYDKDLEVVTRSHLTEKDGQRDVNAAVLREEENRRILEIRHIVVTSVNNRDILLEDVVDD